MKKSKDFDYSNYQKELKEFISYLDSLLQEKEQSNKSEIDLSLGGVTARCFASNFYLELMKKHNLALENKFFLEGKMSNKMSNKDKERLLQIIDYLKINESIKKSEAAKVLNVEDKTAQRLLVKATTLEILKTEGDYKTTVHKLNF